MRKFGRKFLINEPERKGANPRRRRRKCKKRLRKSQSLSVMKRGWFRGMRSLMIGLARRTNLKRVRVRKMRGAGRGNYLSMVIMASGSWHVSKLSMRRNARMCLCGNGWSLIDGSPTSDRSRRAEFKAREGGEAKLQLH